MSQSLCQHSSEKERSDANCMRNSLMRWPDDRIRLTWKLDMCSCLGPRLPSAKLPDMKSLYGYSDMVEIMPRTHPSLHWLWCSGSVKRDAVMISSIMMTDWNPKISRVRDAACTTALVENIHDVMFLNGYVAHPSNHPFSGSATPHLGHRVCWSLSHSSRGESWDAPRIGRQPFTGLTHKDRQQLSLTFTPMVNLD